MPLNFNCVMQYPLPKGKTFFIFRILAIIASQGNYTFRDGLTDRGDT